MPKLGPLLVRVGRYAALWIVVAAFFAVQVRLRFAYADAAVSWPLAFGLALAEWSAWALLAPILWWLAKRFPFERGRAFRSALVHFPVTLIVAALGLVLQYQAVGLLLDAVGPNAQARLARGSANATSSGDLNTALLTVWLISGVCHALVHSAAAQERRARAAELESRLARARLDVLRSQLQPHFLFNTLNAVTTLMHRDIHAAETMLTRLADLLRLTLDLRDRQEVTLREELALTETYLAIQRTRFGERLRTSVEVDPVLYDALVPTMLLQPLVENAIDHGIAQHVGPGEIRLVARAAGDAVLLTVQDNGPGLGVDAPTEGVGLTNTRERLRQLYGSSGRLHIASAEDAGVAVEVRVPLRYGRRAEGDA